MRSEARNVDQIRSIVRYAGKALSYVEGLDFDIFVRDERTQDLVSLCFIQIGEAVGRLSDSFRDDHPDMDWWAIYGLRCYLVHGYENASREILWEVATDDLPRLQQQCLDLLKEVES